LAVLLVDVSRRNKMKTDHITEALLDEVSGLLHGFLLQALLYMNRPMFDRYLDYAHVVSLERRAMFLDRK
jgi:hypothetical protein